jgi:hypothetical protein
MGEKFVHRRPLRKFVEGVGLRSALAMSDAPRCSTGHSASIWQEHRILAAKYNRQIFGFFNTMGGKCEFAAPARGFCQRCESGRSRLRFNAPHAAPSTKVSNAQGAMFAKCGLFPDSGHWGSVQQKASRSPLYSMLRSVGTAASKLNPHSPSRPTICAP